MTDNPSYQELERRLHRSEQRWHRFLSQNVAGIWRYAYRQPMPLSLSVDDQIQWMLDKGVLVECNDVVANMYGYAGVDEVVGKTHRELFQHDLQGATDTLRAWIELGYQFDGYETFQPSVSGDYRCFLLMGFGIRENDVLTGSWGSQIDITDRKRAETALKERAAI